MLRMITICIRLLTLLATPLFLLLLPATAISRWYHQLAHLERELAWWAAVPLAELASTAARFPAPVHEPLCLAVRRELQMRLNGARADMHFFRILPAQLRSGTLISRRGRLVCAPLTRRRIGLSAIADQSP